MTMSVGSQVYGQVPYHVLLPVVGRRDLGDEDEISPGTHAGHESQPATMTAHYFDNKGTLM